MARVSLILPVDRSSRLAEGDVIGFRAALVAAGHEVEIVVASAPEVPERPLGADRWVRAEAPGRAAAAVAGLAQAAGDLLLVVDPARGYGADDPVRLVDCLAAGAADVVVGSKHPASRPVVPIAPSAGVALVARLLTGSTDPLSGLIGLTRSAWEQAVARVRPVGAHFALELLVRVPGRRVDVPARPGSRTGRPGLDELRQLKRLADDRFGNASRLFQFCAVGASGMVIDLSTYALFQWLFARTELAGRHVPLIGAADLAASAFLAVGLALTWNFALNRRLTFNDARSGSLAKQYLAYALSNALAVTVNLTLRLRLPRLIPFFGRHKLAAAVVGIVLATGLSFSMSRWLVFRRRPARPAVAPPHRAADATLVESSVTS